MLIDLGPTIYMALLLYAGSGILLVVLLSLGTWGLTKYLKYLKRVHAKYVRLPEDRQAVRPFAHSH